MLNVRCPACQTVFRANPQQLGAYGGRVRCGRCQHVFNARDHIEGPAEQPQPPLVAPPSASPRTARPPSPAFQHDASTQNVTPSIESSFESLDFVIPEPVKPKTSSKDEIELDWGFSEPGEPYPTPATSPSRRDENTSGSRQALAAGENGHFEPLEPRIVEPSGKTGTLAGQHPPIYTHDDEEPERFKHYAQDEGKHHSWVWAMLIGLMLGTLAVQSAYLFRQEISNRWPEFRPWFEQICQHIGCGMPLATDIKTIRIATSDLESEPAQTGRYVLHAEIRNDARHPQAYPHLELTLTDNRSRPVVRRVLLPEEWLPDTGESQGFAANSSVPVRLPFAAPEAHNAAGYRLYAFYP